MKIYTYDLNAEFILLPQEQVHIFWWRWMNELNLHLQSKVQSGRMNMASANVGLNCMENTILIL
jgi:negative regulator of genetic competence, sporulation and motility